MEYRKKQIFWKHLINSQKIVNYNGQEALLVSIKYYLSINRSLNIAVSLTPVVRMSYYPTVHSPHTSHALPHILSYIKLKLRE